MKRRVFQTITGRALDLGRLDTNEREFLSTVQARYEKDPSWSAFAAWWPKEFQQRGLSQESVAYRICQDLEARLGSAQGMVLATASARQPERIRGTSVGSSPVVRSYRSKPSRRVSISSMRPLSSSLRRC
jgi:hypothetical protein